MTCQLWVILFAAANFPWKKLNVMKVALSLLTEDITILLQNILRWVVLVAYFAARLTFCRADNELIGLLTLAVSLD